MFSEIFDTIVVVQQGFASLWWFWFFITFFILGVSLWLSYVREVYKLNNPWVLLELNVPREVLKSPRAMEQVFMVIHSIRNAPSNLKEKWWDGEVTLWFSCELVSLGGEIHFYMRIPAKHRNFIEAALYAQYSDIEITEAEDYINRLPSATKELFEAGYNMFGNELILVKPDPFPIRTYIEFEEKQEDYQLDPISVLLETMVKMKPQEHLWLQIVIRPTVDDSWKKEGEKVIEQLKEKSGKRKVQTQFGEMVMIDRSPGETEVMKAVERNIEKPGFQTVIRYIYISPKEIYNSNFGQRGILSSLNQYASESANKFRHNVLAWTRTSGWYWPFIFPGRRGRVRKERVYQKYRMRHIYDPSFTSTAIKVKFWDWGFSGWKLGRRVILNVEELATIYHLPMKVVLTGPIIKRVESRKVGPPAGLPIYEDEKEDKLPGIK